MGDLSPQKSRSPDWSDSGSGTSRDHIDALHGPVPTRPRLPSRKSSGTMIVSRDASVGPMETDFAPDDVRSMSPRRTSEDIEHLGKEARQELQRSVLAAHRDKNQRPRQALANSCIGMQKRCRIRSLCCSTE